MSFECRDRCTKIEAKWGKSEADRHPLGRPAWHWTQSPHHRSRGKKTHLPWSMHLKLVWSDDPKGFTHGLKGPLACKTWANSWEPPPRTTCERWSSCGCNGGMSRPAGLQLPNLGQTLPQPSPGEHQSHPGEGRCHAATILSRAAWMRPGGP
jgi:hypothetical protein